MVTTFKQYVLPSSSMACTALLVVKADGRREYD